MSTLKLLEVSKLVAHNVRALRSARPRRFISPYQPKAESSTKDEDKTNGSIYNVEPELKIKEGVKRLLRCVSRADTKPHVMCRPDCVTRSLTARSHTRNKSFACCSHLPGSVNLNQLTNTEKRAR